MYIRSAINTTTSQDIRTALSQFAKLCETYQPEWADKFRASLPVGTPRMHEIFFAATRFWGSNNNSKLVKFRFRQGCEWQLSISLTGLDRAVIQHSIINGSSLVSIWIYSLDLPFIQRHKIDNWELEMVPYEAELCQETQEIESETYAANVKFVGNFELYTFISCKFDMPPCSWPSRAEFIKCSQGVAIEPRREQC